MTTEPGRYRSEVSKVNALEYKLEKVLDKMIEPYIPEHSSACLILTKNLLKKSTIIQFSQVKF